MGRGIRIIGLLCALLLIVAVPVNATENYELTEIVTIQQRFTNISVFVNSFDITNKGKVIVESALSARNCDEVRISMYLQRFENGSWTTVKHWAETCSGTSMLLSRECYEWLPVPDGFIRLCLQ